MPPPRRWARAVVALGTGIVLAACGAPSPGPAPTVPATPGPVQQDPACADYLRYGDLAGTTVTVLEPAADQRITAYDAFETCTGTRVRHEGGESVIDRVAAGNPPDLAYVPEPATLTDLVRRTGAIKPASPLVSANVKEFYPETFQAAGSVDGTLYAAALDASVKSLVWYSPKAFAAKGYTVPATWDEMLALSARIVADGGTPWCAGAEAGDITGWPIADFLEGAVLSEGGPELFDRWVEHTVPADAPPVAAALDRVGAILKDATFVNGGIGDVASITTTPVHDGGLPVLLGGCSLHRQADTYTSSWPDGTDVSEAGDVFAFPLPPRDPAAEPTALVGGGFVAAFSDRREVQALQAYLATPEWANARARDPAGGLVVPTSGLDAANLADPVSRLAVGVLQDPRVALRFDGSDRMPAAVGSGTLPRALTDWVNGASTEEALASVEASWPPLSRPR